MASRRGARAQVERPAQGPAGGQVRERAEAEPGRLVGTGAEGPPGVDDQHVGEGRRRRVPDRCDGEASHAEGAEALAEARDPVDVRDRGRLEGGARRKDGEREQGGLVGEVGEEVDLPPAPSRTSMPAVPASQSAAIARSSSSAATVTRQARMRRSPVLSRGCPSSCRGATVLLLELRHRERLVELLEQLALLGLSCVGTTTRTSTCRSPRPLPPSAGTPWPLTRSTVPDCVPSGTSSLVVVPSSVGTSSVAPSAACGTLTGISQNSCVAVALEEGVLLSRARRRRGRPAGRPRLRARPRREMRSWLPVSTPGGILIWSLRSIGTWPSPWQSLHGLGDDAARAAAAAAGAGDAEEALLERDLAGARGRSGTWSAACPARRRCPSRSRRSRRGGSGCASRCRRPPPRR